MFRHALRRISVCLTLLAGSASAIAADAPIGDVIVLKAARLFDSTGTALRANAMIVVRGDRIIAMGKSDVPAGARVIDLGDATLLPGFIDAHTHITNEFDSNYYRGVYNGLMRFPAEQAYYAALYARRTLEAGFTTIRNLGADDFVDLGLRNAIN